MKPKKWDAMDGPARNRWNAKHEPKHIVQHSTEYTRPTFRVPERVGTRGRKVGGPRSGGA